MFLCNLIHPTITKPLKKLESEVPGFSINLNAALSKEIEDDSIVAFYDCDTFTCKHTFSEHNSIIWGLEVYMRNGKQYMTSASKDKMIRLWDMSNNTLAAKLIGHEKASLCSDIVMGIGHKKSP